jgi:hypothetical protein
VNEAILENLVPTAFAIVTTVIGAILGYILSEVAESRRRARTEKRQAQAMRLLLRLEAERNLNALQAAWSGIGYDASREYGGRDKRDLAYRFLREMPAEFYRDGLNSQYAQMPLLLTAEEINRLLSFYDDLRRISDFHAALTRARTDQQEEMSRFQQSNIASNQPGRGLYAPRQPFDNLADEGWNDLVGVMQRLLRAGNPLA